MTLKTITNKTLGQRVIARPLPLLLLLVHAALFTGCSLYRRSWALPFHATNSEFQSYACERYSTKSDRKLLTGFCSGYAGLVVIGEGEPVLSADTRRGMKAEFKQFDPSAFKIWLEWRR